MFNPNLPFNENIAALSEQIARDAIAATYEKIGVPPFTKEREQFEALLTNVENFDYEKTGASRPVNNTIAGSDAFTFTSVWVPEEYQPAPFNTPARILGLNLLYGSDSVSYRLFAGPEMPPLLVDEDKTEEANRSFSNFSLRGISYYGATFDKRYQHMPTASELRVIYHGLHAVRTDLQVRAIMEESAGFAEEDDLVDAAKWFRDRLHLLDQ